MPEMASVDDDHDHRILIENSEYWLRNIGDLAMLHVTVGRLRAHWPNARIGILTDSPALLSAYFPDAQAITVKADDPWSPPGRVERLAARVGPRWVGPFAMAAVRARRRLADLVKTRLPGLINRMRTTSEPRSSGPHPAPAARGSFAAAAGASLVLVLGGGYLADADKLQATRVFELAAEAQRNMVPVAFVGQGLGPLTDEDLRARASAVLPDAGLIAVRERRRGPALLASMGVSAERVLVTGDDAIALAYARRDDTPGTDLGVCLRVAEYSPVTLHAQGIVGEVVRTVAARHDARLSPLIVSEHLGEDRRSTMPLVRGYRDVRTPAGRFVHPAEVVERVGACRVVVTGAYHLAVFALAQGIPVVGLTSSGYYDDKLLGLADMFGGGLIVVDLRSDDLGTELMNAVESAWESAPDVRDGLRDRAAAQIALGDSGYDRVFALVEDRDRVRDTDRGTVL